MVDIMVIEKTGSLYSKQWNILFRLYVFQILIEYHSNIWTTKIQANYLLLHLLKKGFILNCRLFKKKLSLTNYYRSTIIWWSFSFCLCLVFIPWFFERTKNAWQITFIFKIKITLAITLSLFIFDVIEKSYFKFLDLVVLNLIAKLLDLRNMQVKIKQTKNHGFLFLT